MVFVTRSHAGGERAGNVPTRGSHRNCSRTRARIAMSTHSIGWIYKASQKKRLSVGLIVLVPGSLLSNTHCESPV
jgi:hypothetical protein